MKLTPIVGPAGEDRTHPVVMGSRAYRMFLDAWARQFFSGAMRCFEFIDGFHDWFGELD